MTAADVVYSLNDANANVTETSIHAQAGDLAAMFGEAEEIDTYTVRIPFTRFDIRWQSVALSRDSSPPACNRRRCAIKWAKTGCGTTSSVPVISK